MDQPASWQSWEQQKAFNTLLKRKKPPPIGAKQLFQGTVLGIRGGGGKKENGEKVRYYLGGPSP